MRSLRARAPDEHKRPPRAYVAAIPHFTAFFSFGKTQNLLANLHTVLRFSTCAHTKLRCSSDMLQNTAGNGRCEHLLFSQHSGFFSRGLKMSVPTKPLKTPYCVHLCTYTIQYSIYCIQIATFTSYNIYNMTDMRDEHKRPPLTMGAVFLRTCAHRNTA